MPLPSFAFDRIECVGGRDRYVDRMLAHQHQRDNARAVVTSMTPPTAAFGGGTRRTPVKVERSLSWRRAQGPDFVEVRESERRRADSRAGVDSRQPPWKMEMAARVSRNRSCARSSTQFELAEHGRRREHMMRRIASASSLVERKKNKLDWQIYPTLFMRPTHSSPILDASHLVQDAAQRRHLSYRSASPPARPASARRAERPAGPKAAAENRRPASVRSSRPASARSTRPPPLPSHARPSASPAPSGRAPPLSDRSSRPRRTPRATEAPSLRLDVETDDFASLRETLLHQIVERRLFREADLRRYLQQVQLDNAHVNQAQLQAVVRDVSALFFL